MKVSIVSTYRFDLHDSVCSLLGAAFNDLGIETETLSGLIDKGECRIEDLRNLTSDLVLVFGQPKKAVNIVKHIKPRIVFWNLEPIVAGSEYDGQLKAIMNAKNVKVCSYNEDHAARFKGVKFLPVGYNEVLEGCAQKDRGVCFLGSVGNNRADLFTKLHKAGITIDLPKDSKQELSHYGISLDYNEYGHKETFKWHRFSVSAANQVVFVSTNDWSRYGFVAGRDYIRCRVHKDFIKSINNLLQNPVEADKIATNAKQKFVEMFSMSEWLSRVVINPT